MSAGVLPKFSNTNWMYASNVTASLAATIGWREPPTTSGERTGMEATMAASAVSLAIAMDCFISAACRSLVLFASLPQTYRCPPEKCGVDEQTEREDGERNGSVGNELVVKALRYLSGVISSGCVLRNLRGYDFHDERSGSSAPLIPGATLLSGRGFALRHLCCVLRPRGAGDQQGDRKDGPDSRDLRLRRELLMRCVSEGG